ncbi:uncharacterized protein LOC119681984 [Teleopsis dalmanni]|uniref:uncharacterized protein LOC119681984 n=1 Tax=Teleopsis dalmanni TaxID=139649 RepID=UPI0018CEA616|nr:uncharacterized protein LOC119681984 [Teleopsis dalmanni]
MRTNRFTLQQRLLILKTFYESKLSMVKTLRALKSSDLFAKTSVPSINAIRQLVKKFEQTGQLSDMPRSGRSRSARTQENINKVRESLHNKPDISVRCRALELGMNRTTMCTILKKDLKWEGNYDDEVEDSEDVSNNSDNDSVEFVLNKIQPQQIIKNNIDDASIITTSTTLLEQDDAINEFNVNEISHNDSLDCQTEVLPPLSSDLLGGVNYNKAISYTPLDTGNDEGVFDVILDNNNDAFNNNAIDGCNKNKES